MKDSVFPINLWWDADWIMIKSTAICHISALWSLKDRCEKQMETGGNQWREKAAEQVSFF